MTTSSSAAPSPDEIRLRDPLSDVTRRERRSLLGVSMLGIAIAQAGLIPTEIASLGVKLNQASQSTLLLLLGLICAYYLAAFVAYAASDYVSWKTALGDSIVAAWTQPYQPIDEAETEEEAHRQAERHQRLEDYLQEKNAMIVIAELLVLPVSRMRAAFEFVLPVLVGCYATTLLLWHSAAS